MIKTMAIDVQKWVQILFENHLLRIEYLKLLEMGAFIGILLFISLIFLFESNQIKRTEFLNKNTSSHLEIGLILGTLLTLFLIFFNSSTFEVSIIFLCYIFFTQAVKRVRIHFFEKTIPKTKYQNKLYRKY
jgi:Ca2+/Na+ antiporter